MRVCLIDAAGEFTFAGRSFDLTREIMSAGVPSRDAARESLDMTHESVSAIILPRLRIVCKRERSALQVRVRGFDASCCHS